MKINNQFYNLLILMFFIFITNVSAQETCELIGFWKAQENGKTVFQDFNEKQVLVIDSLNNACRILTFSPYEVVEDTVTIFVPPNNRAIRLVKQFIDCDSLHLINLNRDGSFGTILSLKRIEGHHCDYAVSYYKKKPFFKRDGIRKAGNVLFFIIYFPILIFWFFNYFKGNEKPYLWWLLVFVCLLFCFSNWLIFGLFVFHLSMAIRKYLSQLSLINSVGRVAFYGLYAGLIIMFEYYLRFGNNETYINSYFTFVPVIVNLIGLQLVWRLIQEAYALGFSSFRMNALIAFITLVGPQLYVHSHRDTIISFIQNLIPSIF